MIRAPLDQCLVVQGGPGTGKTAVGLHRAAYLLFEHRRRLVRDGVLVVGPNQVFLDYIANVLPSLGERSVQQRTALELCVPKVDDHRRRRPTTPRVEGRRRRCSTQLERAATEHITVPPDGSAHPARCAHAHDHRATSSPGGSTQALNANAPGQQAARLDEGPGRSATCCAASIATTCGRRRRRCAPRSPRRGRRSSRSSWSTSCCPVRGRGKQRQWTVADQFLVDEANSLLNGTPFTFGHVVVDEAQDHRAVALRCIGRRSPAGSMTILGDLAQSTTPAGQQDWDDALGHLRASRQRPSRPPDHRLPRARRRSSTSPTGCCRTRDVTTRGQPQRARRGRPAARAASSPPASSRAAVADEVRAVRHRHHNTGVVAPAELHAAIAAALAAVGLQRRRPRPRSRPTTTCRCSPPEAVKGLEFDGVVVVNPHQIFDGTARGARLLYVAMTRAVQVLHFVTDAPLPPRSLSGARRP